MSTFGHHADVPFSLDSPEPFGPPPITSLSNNSRHTTLDISPTAPGGAFILHLMDGPQPRNYNIPRRFASEPSIYFFAHSSPRGIRLSDALESNFPGLMDPDVQVMEVSGDKISYTFKWPGYQKITKQMNARRKRGVQSRARIAEQIAVLVNEFIGRQANVTPSASQADWRVGKGAIDLERIYLVEVKRISKATWAVEFAVSF